MADDAPFVSLPGVEWSGGGDSVVDEAPREGATTPEQWDDSFGTSVEVAPEVEWPDDEWPDNDEPEDVEEFKAFEAARGQAGRINDSRERLVELYRDLDGIDVNKANDFDRFVKRALFNRVVCPLCEQDVTDEGVQAHLEVCSKRQTPLTEESNPTAIIVYIQERTREMKAQMKDQSAKIKSLTDEIDILKKQGGEADTDREAKAKEIADLKAALEALRKAKEELEQKLKDCDKALAKARGELNDAIARHEKEIVDLKKEGEEMTSRIAQLESELEALKKAKAEVDDKLAKALGENKTLVAQLQQVEDALAELVEEHKKCSQRLSECEVKARDLEAEQKQLEHDRLTALKAFSAMSSQMSQLLRSLANEVSDSQP